MAEETGIPCDDLHRQINLMKPFNDWANQAELDENPNVKTALMIIRPLVHYAAMFCDGGPVLGQVANIAAIALKEKNSG